MILLILFTVLIIIISITGLKIYLNYKKLEQIPGTWQLLTTYWKIPILSPYVHLGGEFSIRELITKYGDPETGTVRVSFPFRNSVYITHKDLVKEALITKSSNFIKFGKIYQIFKFCGENLLSLTDANSEQWRNHHKICTPAFSTQNLEYVCQVSSETMDFIKNLKWKEKEFTINGSTKYGYYMSDPKSDFSNITLDILGKAGFGLDMQIFTQDGQDNIGQKFRQELEKLFTTGIITNLFIGTSPYLSIFFPLVKKLTGLDKAEEFVKSNLNSIIQQRRSEIEKNIELALQDEGEVSRNVYNSVNGNSERRDILSCLVGANFVQKGVLSDEEIISDSFILALAGHETTAAVLSWTLYELGKRPDIQKKAHEEVDTVLGNRSPTFDDYPNLDYIHCIIMEALRLYSPANDVLRVAKKTTTIGKFTIPKDTVCNFNLRNVNWNDRHYEHAMEFNPDRFPRDHEKRQEYQHDYAWVPFSVGPRKCLGYKFASYEAFIILSKIMQNYNVILLNDESKKSEQVYPIPGATVPPGNLKLFFEKRIK